MRLDVCYINLSGKVTDKNGDPLVGAVVYLEDHSIGRSAGEDGTYKLTIPIKETSYVDQNILFSMTGYDEPRVTVSSFVSQQDHDIKLEERVYEIPGVTVMGYTCGFGCLLRDGCVLRGECRTSFGVDTNDFHTFPKAQIVTTPDSFFVFPNPFSQSFTYQVEIAKKGLYEILLYDVTGKIHWSSTNLLEFGKNEIYVDGLPDVASGRYILNIRSNEMTKNEVIVKIDD